MRFSQRRDQSRGAVAGRMMQCNKLPKREMLGAGEYATADTSALRHPPTLILRETLQHDTYTAAEEVGIQCGHVREVRQEAVRNLPVRENLPPLKTDVDARYEV